MTDEIKEYPIHAEYRLNPSSCALLVIDMQYHDAHPDFGFCAGMEKIKPGSLRYYRTRLEAVTVPCIGSLLDFFRSHNLNVIYLVLGSDFKDYRDLYSGFRRWQLQFEEDTGINQMLWRQSPLYRIREEIAPKADELVIMKKTYGAFASTNLEQLLRNLGIDSLVITGVTTSACPETTAREAADRGFATAMVDEALCDTSEESHNASLESFDSIFGDVLKDTDEVRKSLSI